MHARAYTPVPHSIPLVSLLLLSSFGSFTQALHCDRELIGSPTDCTAVDGGILCQTSPDLCTYRILTTQHICRGGRWEWPDDPVFCDIWSNCTFTPPNVLYCDGENSRPASAWIEVPHHLDPRLTHVTVTGYPALRSFDSDTQLPSVRELNLSHNGLTDLGVLVLQNPALAVLDLSHNSITAVAEQQLPSYGALRVLSLEGNPIVSYGALALHAAIGQCFAAGDNAADAVSLTAPNCTLLRRNVLAAADGKPLTCVDVLCDPGVQVRPRLQCDMDLRQSPSGDLAARKRCDNVADCAGAEDEDSCTGTLNLQNADAATMSGDFCGVVGRYFGTTYAIDRSVLRLSLSAAGISQFHSPILPLSLATRVPVSLVNPSPSTAAKRAVVLATLDGLYLTIDINVTLSHNNYTAVCNFTFDVVGDEHGRVGGGGGNRSSSAAEGSRWTAVGAAIGVLVLIACVFVIVLQRQRRTHARLGMKVDAVAVAAAQRAAERFEVEFGPLVERGQAATYSTLLLPPGGVQLNSDFLGHGEFGSVWRGVLVVPKSHAAWGRLPPTTREGTVAIKTLLITSGRGEAQIVQLLVEARLHACLSHPNLVTLLGVQEAVRPMMLVLEYCEGGNLRDALRARTNCDSGLSDWDEAARRDMGGQVAAGVQYLHSKLCVHRDLAARNVLLARSTATSSPCGYVLKLADLGLSRALREESDYYKSTSEDAVPIRWQCPVAVGTRKYSAKSDVYSFGVLLWEIYSGGATPYVHLAASEVVGAVLAGGRLSRPRPDTPDDIIALIRACAGAVPESRPAMAAVVAQLRGAWTLSFNEPRPLGMAVNLSLTLDSTLEVLNTNDEESAL